MDKELEEQIEELFLKTFIVLKTKISKIIIKNNTKILKEQTKILKQTNTISIKHKKDIPEVQTHKNCKKERKKNKDNESDEYSD